LIKLGIRPAEIVRTDDVRINDRETIFRRVELFRIRVYRPVLNVPQTTQVFQPPAQQVGDDVDVEGVAIGDVVELDSPRQATPIFLSQIYRTRRTLPAPGGH
jgi:hypothetical protein